MWTKSDWIKLALMPVFFGFIIFVNSYFNPDDGHNQEDTGDYKGAVAVITKSLAEDRHKNNGNLYVIRARNKRYLKDFEGAHEDLDTAIKIYETNKKEIGLNKSIYLELSLLHYDERNYEAALSDCKKAQADYDRSDVHSQIALILEDMNRLEDSCKEHDKAVEMARTESHGKYEPDPYEVALHKRANYFWRRDNYDAAFKDYDMAIYEANGTCPGACYGRGYMYLKKKDPKSALKDFDKAIEYSCLKPSSYFCGRGLAYQSLKDYKKAMIDFDKALEKDPENAEAKEAREACMKEMN